MFVNVNSPYVERRMFLCMYEVTASSQNSNTSSEQQLMNLITGVDTNGRAVNDSDRVVTMK